MRLTAEVNDHRQTLGLDLLPLFKAGLGKSDSSLPVKVIGAGETVDPGKDAFTKPPSLKDAANARRVANDAALLKLSKLTREEWLELAEILEGGAATQQRRDYFKARM
jgi:hypothetical protein